jgi:integrase
MPKKRLTEAAVQRLPLPTSGTQADYYDTVMPGLILRVNYGGLKSWRALHYLKRVNSDGKHLTIPTTSKLGKWPVLSLSEARAKAKVFLADPQKALQQADAGTFKDIAANFIKRHVEANKLRSKGDIVRCLEKYVYPHWGNRPFREIRRGDVANLLDHIEDNNGKRMADVVLGMIRSLTNWYVSRDDDYVSPIVKGMKRSNGNGGRARILTDEELRALWVACGGGVSGCPDTIPQFGAYVLTLLLTGQRRTKVATMQWSDLVDGVWTIRSDDLREKNHAGVLKLPQVLIEILHTQPRIAGSPFVFNGQARGRRTPGPAPLRSFAEHKAQLDRKLPLAPWVLHDLRRTARSLMSRAGVPGEHAERVLGHAIRGVEGIYNRHEYTAEKAAALQALADQVDRILHPLEGNVVPLAGSGARGRKGRTA